MQPLDRLPYLTPYIIAGQQSSYDREGGNMDGFGESNFLYTDQHGDKVLFDYEGPGCIYCIWATAFDAADANLKIYFDDEAEPRIHSKLDDLFSGRYKGFSPPLVGNMNASSGGYYSYVPIPFGKSVKVTSNAAGPAFFYHIGYHTYSPDTLISSWTDEQDNKALAESWNRVGTDPKKEKGTESVANSTSLQAGETQTILNISGPHCISSIKLNLPGITTPRLESITEYGRFHVGFSQFVVKIDPKSEGVILKRCLDYSVAAQEADVYVDGIKTGTWLNPGTNTACRFSEFIIGSEFVSNRSEITVKIVFPDSGVTHWTEFGYWVYSKVKDVIVLTDSIDIGDNNSESAHQYMINAVRWEGEKTFKGAPINKLITDSGREHTGESRFKMNLNPNNAGVYLSRRFRSHSGSQCAKVYVDGNLVGEWLNASRGTNEEWRDSYFYISDTFTSGKEKVKITIENASPDHNWSEYCYNMYCILGDGKVLTDTLDIGDHSSQLSHEYSIDSQTWYGETTLRYYELRAGADELLNNIWIRAYWDNEKTPAIYAPVGSFFGVGQFGPGDMKSLPVGIDENDDLYMFFPMPFEENARIELENQFNSNIDDVFYEIKYSQLNDSMADMGYFKTYYLHQTLSADNDNDVLFLDTEGSGSFIGVIDSMEGPISRIYQEGDERIYVDGSQSPAIHGTGKEDFFHGAYYFLYDTFCTPMHGSPTHRVLNNEDQTAAYRFYLQDAIPFRNHIRVGIEHGPRNDCYEKDWTLAYYYHRPEKSSILTDMLDIGEPESEEAHGYTILSETSSSTCTHSYEGDFDNITITDRGRSHRGSSEFTMSIDSSNQGAILRRRFDQGTGNQKTNVYIDDKFVGKWYKAGNNVHHRWRDEDFIIPPSYTAGKSSIKVKIEFLSSDIDWNEFKYWAFSINNNFLCNDLCKKI